MISNRSAGKGSISIRSVKSAWPAEDVSGQNRSDLRVSVTLIKQQQQK